MQTVSTEGIPQDRRVRDLAAVVLITLGLIALPVATWTWDWHLGLATVALEALALGGLLGIDS